MMTRERFEVILNSIANGEPIANARNRLELLFSAIAEKIGSSGSGGVDYSTSEVDTGIKWIDGKSIYRKVIQTTISDELTNIDTSDLHIDSLVNSYAYVINTSETENAGTILELPYIESDTYSCQLNFVIPNKIAIYSGSGIVSNYTSCTIIIEYTKVVS